MSDLFAGLGALDWPHGLITDLRYSDTDRQGHVNNAVYATLFEFGRTRLFATDLSSLVAPGREPVLVRIVIDYRRELHWPGRVRATTGVSRIGTTSAVFAQAVFNEDHVLAAIGEAVVVQLESETRKPIAWTNDQRASLERFTLPAA